MELMQENRYKKLTISTGILKKAINPLYSKAAKNCSIKKRQTKYSANRANKLDMPR